MGGVPWKFKRGYRRGALVGKGSCHAVYHNVGSDVLLDRDHGDRTEVRPD